MKARRGLAFLLSVLIAAGAMAGCQKNAQPVSESPGSTAPAAGTTGVSGTPELIRDNIYTSGFPILKEKKTYTIAVTKDPNSQNGFADKQCVQETNELTNVEIEWLDIPQASWDEQVNIMIAAGNLPDAFCGKDVKIMQNLEMFQPIGDLVYALAPSVVEMLSEDAAILQAITAPDGNIYSLPTNKNNPSNVVDNMLWINPDWLKQAGMEPPKTTDEFVEVLRYFRDHDMNGNGDPNDEIPFQARQQDDYAHNLSAITGAFDVVLPKDYVYSKDGSTVVFGGTEPGLYDALNWLHMLYEEKLLDNETFTMDNSQQNAKAQNEDVLMGSLIYWIPDSMDSKYEDYIVLDPLTGPGGAQIWYGGAEPIGANIQGFSVTTACEDPEVMIRYYDACMRDMQTIMEWQWGPIGGGNWKPVGEDQWTQTTEFVPEGTNLTFFKRTICGSIYSPNFIWSKYAEKEIADARNAKKREAAQRIKPFCVEVMPKALYDPDVVTQRELLYTDIDNYMKKFIATSVVNGLSEAEWQSHLDNCKKMNVEEYTALWQQYFTDVKAK